MNIVNFIFGFLLYVYITCSIPKKLQLTKNPINLHTPYHTTTEIFYSAIFTATPKKFQENNGFLSQNTETCLQHRILNYFLNFIF